MSVRCFNPLATWCEELTHWKDPDAGKDWRREGKGKTEDEMVGWHHRFNGHGFGWTLGVGDEQGGLACCGSRVRKQSDVTVQLNWTGYTEVCILSSLKQCTHVHTYTHTTYSGVMHTHRRNATRSICIKLKWNLCIAMTSPKKKKMSFWASLVAPW